MTSLTKLSAWFRSWLVGPAAAAPVAPPLLSRVKYHLGGGWVVERLPFTMHMHGLRFRELVTSPSGKVSWAWPLKVSRCEWERARMVGTN